MFSRLIDFTTVRSRWHKSVILPVPVVKRCICSIGWFVHVFNVVCCFFQHVPGRKNKWRCFDVKFHCITLCWTLLWKGEVGWNIYVDNEWYVVGTLPAQILGSIKGRVVSGSTLVCYLWGLGFDSWTLSHASRVCAVFPLIWVPVFLPFPNLTG